MRFLLLAFFIGFNSLAAFAQAPDACGTSTKDQFLIREKMFQNRLRISQEEVERIQNQRFVIYIPAVIHLVGDSLGNSVAGAAGVIGMMCRLNEDFADQNIQFYIKDSLRYVYDNIINADSYDSIAIDRMIALKDTTALNIFINGSAGGGVAGYYSRRGDFVFILSPYAQYGSTTITHELGHFFTLPHTFFGWEGKDAPSMYGTSPAPDSVETDHGQKVEVEYVSRSGTNSNCYSSADGFCDTEADYLSFRLNCPNYYQVQDPSGTYITPDHNLYMSYFLDNCMDSFSSEQKIAMMSDIIDRNWLNFPAPSSNAVMTGTNVNLISPVEASTVSGNPNDLIRFEWDTTGAFHATKWVVEVERLFNGIPLGNILVETVSGQSFLEVPFSQLGSNRDFRWRVLPYSNGYFCAEKSPFSNFSTGTIVGLETPTEASLELSISPNPIQNKTVSLNIKSLESHKAEIRIYAFDGRLIHQQRSWIDAGKTNWQIYLGQLPAGLYQLILESPQGQIQKKFSISN